MHESPVHDPRIPWMVSPRIFKLPREEIIRLNDEGFTLLRMSELKQQIGVIHGSAMLAGQYAS